MRLRGHLLRFAPLDAFDVDRAARRIAFDTRVTYRGETTADHTPSDGARDLTRRDPDNLAPREPGDRIEGSVIEVEREPGGWRVWFNPWYLEGIEFRCSRSELDGAELVRAGRRLQDDLPSRPDG